MCVTCLYQLPTDLSLCLSVLQGLADADDRLAAPLTTAAGTPLYDF